ncbi:photosystem II protein PsbQ [Leptolyngbya sp. AN02str]|uniref:photosystem II protein PsbQ n=1 Tax=Leptolyngbya sp. AN02str TaxID=3423363 RepID=UPI003D31CF4D
MIRVRSILALIIAAIAIFTVSCSSPKVAKGPLYTTEQLAQIQKLATDVEDIRERMLGIPPLVQKGDWNDVSSYIHGPLGEMRFKMSTLARSLKPKDTQAQAQELAKNVFGHLNVIDEGVQTLDSRKALLNYNEALRDFDEFLKLIPTQAS